ncbi:MAG: hypothetical protein L6V93_01895 [Clostridiales bacterium]|nr:MAG: hypothetical protein L6V93_01895 [Clostridiales bacterium]
MPYLLTKKKTYYDYNSKNFFHLEGKSRAQFDSCKDGSIKKIGENFEDLTDFKKLMYVGQAYTDENKDFSFDVYAEEKQNTYLQNFRLGGQQYLH